MHLHVHVNAINIPEQLLSAYELLLQTESERNIDITISPFPDYFFSFAVINMEPPPGTMGLCSPSNKRNTGTGAQYP